MAVDPPASFRNLFDLNVGEPFECELDRSAYFDLARRLRESRR